MFSIAHLSDVHLGPLRAGSALRDFQVKRIIGYFSWRFDRKKVHDPAIAAVLAADIVQADAEHVAFTGDIMNISALAEFPRAALWIARLGPVSRVTFVPGNHDSYVEVPWEHGLGHLAPWMTGDMTVALTQTDARIATPFPFVRLRKNVAFIGLSTALPEGLNSAGGELGKLQLDSLAQILGNLRLKGYARIVLLHHPPLPGQNLPRKALRDAAGLRDVLAREGAELVLHGHNHRHMRDTLETRFGICHVLGVESASVSPGEGRSAASWNLCRIVRQEGRWQIAVTVRSYDAERQAMQTANEFTLET